MCIHIYVCFEYIYTFTYALKRQRELTIIRLIVACASICILHNTSLTYVSLENTKGVDHHPENSGRPECGS
jgi:hypothetical protein